MALPTEDSIATCCFSTGSRISHCGSRRCGGHTNYLGTFAGVAIKCRRIASQLERKIITSLATPSIKQGSYAVKAAGKHTNKPAKSHGVTPVEPSGCLHNTNKSLKPRVQGWTRPTVIVEQTMLDTVCVQRWTGGLAGSSTRSLSRSAAGARLFAPEEPMNEPDKFLRDRVRPAEPGRSGALPRDPRTGPHQIAAPPSPAAPHRHAARPAPPSPAAAPMGTPLPTPPSPGQPIAAQPQPAVPPQPPWESPPPPAALAPALQSETARPLQPWIGRDAKARDSYSPRSDDQGWRRIIRLVTRRLADLSPASGQREAAQFEAVIRTVLQGNHKVGVLGKGGVGKTSVAASVGSILAELRQQDRVVAIDADTAFGRLSSRIDPAAKSSFWELTSDKNLHSFTDLTSRLGSNSAGLYVLAGEPASGRRQVLDPAIYREAALRLDRHFTMSVIDCGATMDAAVTQEVLRDLDALIIVSSPWADGASAAAKTLEWLSDHDMTELLRRTIVALNDSDGHADKRTRSLLAKEFIDHGQPVIEVPFDPHLRPGGVIDVSHEMAPATRLKFLRIAATITQYFASRPDGAQANAAPQLR